ncbi:RagB/SusD family nutrient uptake outer membrane protein [Gracilimonas mengyeensis]|nr:RagB/SusD family nutrient uptake outer membrane protein [Gracilimonas mengyeensis]
MKRYNLLIATVLTLFIATSCDSLLDIEPTQEVSEEAALASSENIQSILIGAYNSIADDDFLGGGLATEAELLSHDSADPEINFTGTFQTLRQIYNKQVQTTNGQIEATYNRAYITVNLTNIVLANLDKIEDEAVRQQVQGEALFLRGLTFFEMVKMYAAPYSAGNTGSNPGIQIVTEPEEDYANIRMIGRSSVEDTYQQILSDLTTAKSLMAPTNGVFAGSLTASAVLSRVYLQMGDYENAAIEASTVIESGAYSLVSDYSAAFNNSNVNTSEDIFAIQVSDQDGANDLNLYFAAESAGGRGDIDITPAHIALYEEGDARLDLFYYDDPSAPETSPLRTGKWRNQYGNVNVIRLSEMYLTRAEANFELSVANQVGPNTPIEDVNIVRERVGLDPLLPVDFTLEDILMERKLELAFEGRLLHDLKRRQSDVGTVAYDSQAIIFPVPQRETNINPDLN